MGKAEKIIVLTVLLAISGILAVSLNTGSESARGPLSRVAERSGLARPVVLAAESEDDSTAATEENRTTTSIPTPDTPGEVPALLAATLPQRETGVATPAPAPEGSALLSLADLEPSGRPDYYFYTWRAGDNFTKVARRLYGDPEQKELLRRHNEGRLHVPAGGQIFVPVFADGASPDPLTEGGGRTRIVKDGESLWTIAKDVYGSGARWMDLFDANRDQLANANQLKPGMVLRVP